MNDIRIADPALLRESLDYRIGKREILLNGITFLAVTLLFALIALLTKSPLFLLVSLPLGIFCFSTIIFKIRKMRMLVKNYNGCPICESVLTDPKPCFNAGIYFTVTIRDTSGRILKKETNAIGTTRGITRPHFSDLNKARVLLCFQENGGIIVLKLL